MNQDKDFVENHFYKLNRVILSIVKLWPNDSETIFAKVYRVFIFTMLLSITFVQLTALYRSKFSTEVLMNVLSFVLPNLTIAIEYYLFYNKFDKVKQIWKFICDDFNALKDQKEREIIKQYSDMATRRVIRITAFVMAGFLGYIFLELSPIILDVILPLNKPRRRKLIFNTEYFVDIQIYFYPIVCHWLFGIFSVDMTLIAIVMFHMMCIHHICGLLKTGCYRLQHSLDKYTIFNKQTDDSVVVQKISNAVQIHRKAIEYVDFWISGFVWSLMIAMIFIVVFLSLTLFRLFMAIVNFDAQDTQKLQEIGTSLMIIVLGFLVIFLGNNYPQKIIDHHNEIFDTVCNVRWYRTPIKIQKLILFIMTKTTKTYAVQISNVFTASLENFIKLASMPISYFTVLYSVTK